ncbi:response regulator [Brevibacillus ginsengisoli]|uniref:response regulator n=1 Tax=Brevibacillus ginsengisoli TaxID=363854 RepID=UPI003CFA9E62
MLEPNILLVEDDPDIRELVRLYLNKEGFHVLEAATGEEAIRLAKQECPALMILDILLPGLDGMTVCKEVRKQSDLPIIFLSCKMDSSDIIKGLDIGADDYVTKPFDPSILVSRVKAQMRRYQNRSMPVSELTSPIPLPQLETNHEPLTKRESEVLSLIARGYTNQEIAAYFHISLGTVKGYNNQLYSKLQVKNRTQAIMQARQLGILTDEAENQQTFR